MQRKQSDDCTAERENSLGFCPSPLPSPQLFFTSSHLLSLSPPQFYTNLARFSFNLPIHSPPLPLAPSLFVPLYRWTTVTDDLTIANPCRHPLLICSEFLTASPLETVAKKPPSHFIPSPALPIVLLSSSFARTATSSTSSSSSSSLFHLPSTCNLVGTHVTMVVENSKDRPPLGSMLASNLHVSFMANVWRAKENVHIGVDIRDDCNAMVSRGGGGSAGRRKTSGVILWMDRY